MHDSYLEAQYEDHLPEKRHTRRTRSCCIGHCYSSRTWCCSVLLGVSCWQHMSSDGSLVSLTPPSILKKNNKNGWGIRVLARITATKSQYRLYISQAAGMYPVQISFASLSVRGRVVLLALSVARLVLSTNSSSSVTHKPPSYLDCKYIIFHFIQHYMMHNCCYVCYSRYWQHAYTSES
jgi:hypothetical protein